MKNWRSLSWLVVIFARVYFGVLTAQADEAPMANNEDKRRSFARCEHD
jgi:hypothetical protein